LELVRLFFAAVVGRQGSFRIARDEAQIPWTTGADEPSRDRVHKLLRPISAHDGDADGRQRFRAPVIFNSALYANDILSVSSRLDPRSTRAGLSSSTNACS